MKYRLSLYIETIESGNNFSNTTVIQRNNNEIGTRHEVKDGIGCSELLKYFYYSAYLIALLLFCFHYLTDLLAQP